MDRQRGQEPFLSLVPILAQAQRRLAMRLIGYCLMLNHWRLVLWPHADGDLSEFGLESDLRPRGRPREDNRGEKGS